jgi:hypothetical protein
MLQKLLFNEFDVENKKLFIILYCHLNSNLELFLDSYYQNVLI